jgi:Ca2+-binding RTX toxin-like protein
MITAKRIQRLAIINLTILIVISAASAITATNTVPSSHLDEVINIINANLLKPAQCSAITLTAILYCPTGGGNCDGTDASELVLGSSVDDNIRSGKGDDCVLGGDGNDTIAGEQNTDVCFGGPGPDGFHPSCETQIQ